MHRGQFWPFWKWSRFSKLDVFWSVFLHRTFLKSSHNRFPYLFSVINFWQNWPFCMGYSPCIGANFGPYENALVFRILCVFWSCFLYKKAPFWSFNRFWHLLAVFNFWPRLTILYGLKSMHRGQFRPFWKCSRLSNTMCFLERFFGHNISNVIAELLFLSF